MHNLSEGWGVYLGVGGVLLLPLLLVVLVCTVCKGEGGTTEGLVHIFLRARPVCLISLTPCTTFVPASTVIPLLACTRGPGTLKPSSSSLSQIQQDTGGHVCLSEILISEYAQGTISCYGKNAERCC